MSCKILIYCRNNTENWSHPCIGNFTPYHRVYNVDGTPNKWGTIRYYVDLKIEVHGQTQKERLLVTGLGKHRIILGLPWLCETNPIIDWRKGTLEWREQEPPDNLWRRWQGGIPQLDSEPPRWKWPCNTDLFYNWWKGQWHMDQCQNVYGNRNTGRTQPEEKGFTLGRTNS